MDKLAECIKTVVASKLTVICGPQPLATGARTLEAAVVQSFWDIGHEPLLDSDDPMERGHRRTTHFEAIGHELLDVLSGDWRSESIVHHCWAPGGGRCCASTDESVDRIAALLTDTLLGSLPTTPVKERWTRLAPCVVWWLRGRCLHNMLFEAMGAVAPGVAEQGGAPEAVPIDLSEQDLGAFDFQTSQLVPQSCQKVVQLLWALVDGDGVSGACSNGP